MDRAQYRVEGRTPRCRRAPLKHGASKIPSDGSRPVPVARADPDADAPLKHGASKIPSDGSRPVPSGRSEDESLKVRRNHVLAIDTQQPSYEARRTEVKVATHSLQLQNNASLHTTPAPSSSLEKSQARRSIKREAKMKTTP